MPEKSGPGGGVEGLGAGIGEGAVGEYGRAENCARREGISDASPAGWFLSANPASEASLRGLCSPSIEILGCLKRLEAAGQVLLRFFFY